MRITQDAFDELVKENVEDFDMGREEAAEDAVKQFQAQVREGVVWCGVVWCRDCEFKFRDG
jgi:hypothetical protein